MKKQISQYIPLHLSVFLTLGVLFSFYFDFPILSYGIIFIFTIFSLILSYRNQHLKRIFQVAAYFATFTIGATTMALQKPSNTKYHYSHYFTKENNIVFQVDQILKPNRFYDKYVVSIIQTETIKTEGRVLLSVLKNEKDNPLQVGQIFFTNTSFSKVNSPVNPFTFDYRKYLFKQGIYHQITIQKKNIKKAGLLQNSFTIWAANWRKQIQDALSIHKFSMDEMSIINAILLGQRQSISKELLESYAGAGAIHILAVSGLHIGILFLLLSYLLQPLEKFNNGAILKMVIIIVILWSFALLAGLKASVVRAVSMFSFIAMGLLIKKQRSPILHALITSFFVLVILHPLFVFDVGFQMSYAAVLGIVLIQPEIEKSIPKINWILPKKAGQLISVSIAATIGTLPISLYYFHQFPGLFFVSNLVIVPLLGIILGLGILVIVLALFSSLPYLLVQFYAFVLQSMNNFIQWIAHQEQFLIKNISFSIYSLSFSYLVIVTAYYLILKKEKTSLRLFLLAIIALQMVFIFEKHQAYQTNELFVFHKNKESIISCTQGNKLQILTSIDSLPQFVFSYQLAKRSKELKSSILPNCISFQNSNILIIDSLGIFQKLNFKANTILLRQSPKVNMNRVLEECKPKVVIADGSNYKSYIISWQKTCIEKNITFHYTGFDGAYSIK